MEALTAPEGEDSKEEGRHLCGAAKARQQKQQGSQVRKRNFRGVLGGSKTALESDLN